MSEYKLYWGDIHNHNELGYGQGSLTRSYEIARSHLDFYAFTPHAQHADGGVPEGYENVRENWGAIQEAAAEQNDPGRFTALLAYEWHSNAWGHVHIVYFEDHQALHYAPSLSALQDHFRGQRAILVPHHIGYLNGVDWDLFDGALSPVVEIFSEHGCSERDFGPYPMLGHSGGPGGGRFTAQHGLAIGNRFGFTAGTDNHDGYPGGYGLGLTGVWAEENTRASIEESIRNHRTFAVTGDRIAVDFRAGDACMGSVVDAGEGSDLRFHVEGWDFIRQVDLVRDNRPVEVQTLAPADGADTYRLRLEWGWGPMKGYQVFDWEGELHVQDGEIQQVAPCFSSDPFDEVRRKEVLAQDGAHCRFRSHTSRGGVFTTRNSMPVCSANDALCVEVKGSEQTQVRLEMRCETRKSLLATPADWSIANRSSVEERTWTIGALLDSSDGFRMGTSSWVKAHRAVPRAFYALSGEARHSGGPAVYYLRVMQENGQMAWSSPIWLEG